MTYATDVGYLLKGDTIAEAHAAIVAVPHDDLAAYVLNDTLNEFIRNNADAGALVAMLGGEVGEVTIPYHGWYWRDVDLVGGYITVADGGSGAGGVRVCENNKWGYPQRSLTTEEAAQFVAIVWEAWNLSRAGGVASEIEVAVKSKLREAGVFVAGLTVPAQGYAYDNGSTS